MPNRRRNRNNRARSHNPRRAKHPSQVSRNNNQITTRTFRATSQIFCQSINASSPGVQGGFAYTASVDQYQGHEFIEQNFEQYKVTAVEILMRPSAATLNNGNQPTTTQEAIAYQNSVYSAMNSTSILSFIDHDTSVRPTFVECEQRPNLKVNALRPNNWTKIARFSPKTLSNASASGTGPSNTFNSSIWMTTENLGTELFGLRGLAYNTAPVFDAQDNVLSVDVRLSIVVQMKGPKNSTASTANVARIPQSRDYFLVSPQHHDEDPSDSESETEALPPKALSLLRPSTN